MSSNSSAIQGLQPCFNPLTHKPESSFPWFESQRDDSFVQAFKHTPYDFRLFTNESKQAHINPCTNHSTSPLTTRNLELCTETLGNESGSSTDLNLDEYSHLLSEKQSFIRTKPTKTRDLDKNMNRSSSFPPPLSSINGVEVKAHRGGGRLVITAFNFCGSRSYFKSERENGRLRLFLVKDDYVYREGELSEKVNEEGGKFSSRCNGDGSGRKKIPCLPLCAVISS